jgi:hypothetical protein
MASLPIADQAFITGLAGVIMGGLFVWLVITSLM